VKLQYELVRAPLASPFTASHGSVEVRALLLVTLESADGLPGYGEAAPLPSYDGFTIAQVSTALEACRPVLSAAEGQTHARVLAQCAEVTTVSPALAALDLALWDLTARRAGQPIWKQLQAPAPDPVQVNWTITSSDRAGAAAEAARACQAGFTTLKVKVAIGDDAGRLAAIRSVAGPNVGIRIDANGAWTVAEAQAALRMLEPINIEFCEEPVSGLEAIHALSPLTPIPLALDETARHAPALDEQACALVCLKVSTCGGLTGLLAAARRAEAAGYEVYLASSLDGPLGIAAALHAAAALAPRRACGLATLSMVSDRPNPLPAEAGHITVPAGPGLGDGLLDWYRAR
jgi:o-succinylbenzoate synthase